MRANLPIKYLLVNFEAMINSERVVIKPVEFGSDDYRETVILRDKILRKPLNMRFTEEQLFREVSDYHLAAFDNERMVGCLILTPAEEGWIKMRQVAVDKELQRSGIGRRLVMFSEAFALNRGFSKMYCHARDNAVPFYLQLEYEIVGEPFTEIGITHFRMVKELDGSVLFS